MKEFQTKDIRNVALIGAAKSGKTTLAENMLFEGKLINRKGSTDEKNTVSDYRPIEMERQISVNASMMYTIYNDKKINILDTPGFTDFSGDIVSAASMQPTWPFAPSMPSRVLKPLPKTLGVMPPTPTSLLCSS